MKYLAQVVHIETAETESFFFNYGRFLI